LSGVGERMTAGLTAIGHTSALLDLVRSELAAGRHGDVVAVARSYVAQQVPPNDAWAPQLLVEWLAEGDDVYRYGDRKGLARCVEGAPWLLACLAMCPHGWAGLHDLDRGAIMLHLRICRTGHGDVLPCAQVIEGSLAKFYGRVSPTRAEIDLSVSPERRHDTDPCILFHDPTLTRLSPEDGNRVAHLFEDRLRFIESTRMDELIAPVLVPKYAVMRRTKAPSCKW
jgi:hypothetical protein